MGTYFRKSKKIGKNTRLNFSKSGIGISTGVKGARIGANKKGTYVSGGKDGIYYRKQLSNNKVENLEDLENERPSVLGIIGTFFQLIGALIQLIFYGFILFLIIKFIIMLIKL